MLLMHGLHPQPACQRSIFGPPTGWLPTVHGGATSTNIIGAGRWDDPTVPVTNFTNQDIRWPETTTLHIARTGGHAAFIDRDHNSWMDRAIVQWFS